MLFARRAMAMGVLLQTKYTYTNNQLKKALHKKQGKTTRTTEGRCREDEDASGVESAASDIKVGVEREGDGDER